MRLFTVLGVVFLVVGVGLAAIAMLPGGGSFSDEFRTQGAGIASVTLIPMGIVFTAIGVYVGRLTAGRKRLLREGIPGQATILSLDGGNMVVNNINYLMTFQLMVSVPGRQPYQVEHRQLVPIFAIASLPIGSTVAVMVDREDPRRLTIDLAGEGAALRQAAAMAASATAQPGQVVPNTLSTMRGATANTFTTDPSSPTPAWPVPQWQDMPMPAAMATIGGSATAAGTGANLTQPPPNGRPGSAVIREANDTGIVVQGDAVVELRLDVTPDGGAPYEVRTAALVPAAARARALPGTTVPVRIDPTQPGNVLVDWRL